MASPCLLAWLLAVLAVCPAYSQSFSSDRSGLQRLHSDLRRGTHSATFVLPPSDAAGGPVEVSVGLALNFVTVVSDDAVDIDGWLSLQWNDPQFRWNPEDYNTTSIRLPQEMIWTPDIVPYNNIDIRQRTMEKFLAMVNHDGEVIVYNKMTIRLPCVDDSGHRTCKVKFGSWTYDGLQLDVKKRSDADLLTDYTPSKDYKVTNAKATRNVLTYACCAEPYPDVTFTFDLERRGWDWNKKPLPSNRVEIGWRFGGLHLPS